MKLQDLHVLMTVVQAGSMGKAARTPYITHPPFEINRGAGTRGGRAACSIAAPGRRAHRVRSRATQRRAAYVDDLPSSGEEHRVFLADPTPVVRIGCSQFLTTDPCFCCCR